MSIASRLRQCPAAHEAAVETTSARLRLRELNASQRAPREAIELRDHQHALAILQREEYRKLPARREQERVKKFAFQDRPRRPLYSPASPKRGASVEARGVGPRGKYIRLTNGMLVNLGYTTPNLKAA